jgi:hypothetical protein
MCLATYQLTASLTIQQGGSSPSINGATRSPAPSSPYAPRIISIQENTWVGFTTPVDYTEADLVAGPPKGALNIRPSWGSKATSAGWEYNG